eukprot:TRINITY_DN2179_c0_g1_i1.p1 TRINITY_DN2179_c0_g1~~TRINITY_DN2179_c0_g1_i1.p1  ORF type:complete len:353 (-),score=72.17 TRINITY_DN2179_c0_g1_i1:33-1091(-)
MSENKISNRKIICKQLSTNFREATEIHAHEIDLATIKADEVVVQNVVLGINASDINFTAGRYFPDPKKIKLPFDCGFESLGKIVYAGADVKRLKKGDFVLISVYGAFTEHMIVKEKQAHKIPAPAPELLTFQVSGLTASIGLTEAGEMKENGGETVLVTAAAGATGLFAVQLAKLAGNHVIATCSTEDKVEVLRKLGCDRVINYKKENLGNVLRTEYPKGVNIVYESVGGDTFTTCVRNLAPFGRLVIIGAISQYQESDLKVPGLPAWLPTMLIQKSATVRGFFLPNSTKNAGEHLKKILTLFQSGKLKVPMDQTNFTGLESVADAVEYLYTGKNVGKVVVHLNPNTRKSAL